MAFKSFTTLLAETVQRTRQVGGAGTQLYAEPVLSQYLQEAFDIVRAEDYWPQMMAWKSGTLDGSTGQVASGALSPISDFNDILGIYYESYQERLPTLPLSVNPYSIVGSVARYVEPLAIADEPTPDKLFKVWPLTLTGTVRVHARVIPTGAFTNPAVIIPFDHIYLENYAAWRWFSDDAANPAAANAALQVMEERKKQLIEMRNSQPSWLDPQQTITGTGWWERP